MNLAVKRVRAGGERRQRHRRATLNFDVKYPSIRSHRVGNSVAIGCAQRVGALDNASNGKCGVLDHDARDGVSFCRT